MTNSLVWDTRVRFVITDVDDTLAPTFGDVRQDVAESLSKLMCRGVKLFLISGQSIANICRRVVLRLPTQLRQHVLVAHCNGCEVFGFSEDGKLILPCLWSSVTPGHRAQLRATLDVVKKALDEFRLVPTPARPTGDPRRGAVAILDDRQVQISIDIVEPASGSTDQGLRSSIAARVNELLAERGISAIEARLGGVSGIDCLPSHVHKGLPVSMLMRNSGYGIAGSALGSNIQFPQETVCEVWGDQFSILENGSDVRMALAAPCGTRIISFRSFPGWDIPEVSGMRVWPGPRYLDAGLSDYLLTAVSAPQDQYQKMTEVHDEILQ